MILIQEMTIEDYEGVYTLWSSTPEMGLNETDDSRDGIEKYLKRNPATSFVALDGDRIVGAILAGHDGRRGFVQHMTVLPAYRRQGVATRLLHSAMEALEKEGIHKVALLNFIENQPANSFWQKNGFQVRSDVYYRNKSIHELQYRPNPFRNE